MPPPSCRPTWLPSSGGAVISSMPSGVSGQLEWLCGRLSLDRDRLPRHEACEQVVAGLVDGKVRLIFPDGYMNAPSSMFGHTLLMLEGRRAGRCWRRR